MNNHVTEVRRMHAMSEVANPEQGRVVWSPVKSLWFFGHLLVALIGGLLTFDKSPICLSAGLTVLTLCLGHTVGLHRLLIHRSFECPKWLEQILVYLGTLVGMGGPFGMIYLHEIRDWAQRHVRCHPFFIHQTGFWRDAWWNLHAEIRLKNPPRLEIEPEVAHNPFYQFLQSTWMLHQVPLALLLYACAGWPWIVWGISMRIVTSLTGHWLIGHLAHHFGQRDWHLEGHAVQGYNLPRLGLLTMGECWHNNHHAYPKSARLGLRQGQHDPGWWFIALLRRVGLAWNVRLPENLPPRPERLPLPHKHPSRRLSAHFDLL
jgi:stearoyl-CoA desaturase (delta-9 desaturase)